MDRNTIVILDNGHGRETSGKRSPIWPFGQLFEYEFNRDIAARVHSALLARGVRSVLLVPELNDIPLSMRSQRANKKAAEAGGNAFLVSIHANAGKGTGWEIFTTKGTTKSDALATIFWEEAKAEFAPDGWKMRSDMSDGDPDKESDFWILRKVSCPAVLTENFFMDTEKDCRLIMSEAGRARIAAVHIRAILKALGL